MGILDDAIRQHLDLKRQRGATESELKQLEDEAFGPPSRPGEPDFPGEEGHDQNGNGVAADATPVSEPEPQAVDEESEATEPTPESEELTAIFDEAADRGAGVAEEVEDEAVEPAPAAPIESLDTVEHSLPEEEVEPGSPPADEPAHESQDEAVPAEEQEEPPEEEPLPDPEEGEGEDEDVLADTPEFLKDAPEDDELWFEQGKPKDFDF